MGLIKKVVKLSIKQKTDILEKLKNGETVKSICLHYNVNKSTVCRIKQNEKNIKKFISATESGPGKRMNLRCAEFPKLEKALVQWFLKQRARNVPISEEMLKSKALYFHRKHPEKAGGFNASLGWIKKFKARHGIRRLKICGEKLSNKPQYVDAFLDKFRSKVNEMGLSPDQIYNCDESGLFYRLLPNRTLVSLKETSAPGRKVSKERITFLPCTNASGTHKLKMLVIGKSANPRAFRNFKNNPVHYMSSKNAWMTSILFDQWFKRSFVPEVTKFLKIKDLPNKALLLIDNAPCHPKDNVFQNDDIEVVTMCLPPNCTAILQPLDQNVINLTKQYYKKNLLTHLVALRGEDLDEKIRNFNLRKAVNILAIAWERVSATSIKNCWNVLMENDVHWSNEDDIPLSIIRAQILDEQSVVTTIEDLLLNISPNINVSEGEINEWLNETQRPDICEEAEEISDVEISSVEGSSEEEDVELSTITTDQVLKALDIGIQWAAENDIPFQKIAALGEVKEIAVLKKLQSTKKQTSITRFFTTNSNT